MESTKGKGSYFWVQFPVQQIEKPQQEAVKTKGQPALRNSKILIVEDNEINRLVVGGMLEKAGHKVYQAHDGSEGVRMSEAEHYDLILMDISMPVMDGRAATRAIREGSGRSAHTPIIALTANAMAEEQEAFISDGMNAVLTKPLSRDALDKVIKHWVQDAPPVQADVSQSHLDELRETVGDDVFGQLATRFSNDVDTLISTLTDPSQQDYKTLITRTHQTAGSAASFGATDLRAVLNRIENALKKADADALTEACEELSPIWHETREKLISKQSR